MSKRGSCHIKALTLKGIMIAQSCYIDECCVEIRNTKNSVGLIYAIGLVFVG